MEASIDSDGDLVIEDDYNRCFLRPDLDGRLLAAGAIFGSTPYADEQAKLRFVNRVNDGLMMIRASVTSDGRFFFDYYIPIEGGTTRKAVVLAVRRFVVLPGVGHGAGHRRRGAGSGRRGRGCPAAAAALVRAGSL